MGRWHWPVEGRGDMVVQRNVESGKKCIGMVTRCEHHKSLGCKMSRFGSTGVGKRDRRVWVVGLGEKCWMMRRRVVIVVWGKRKWW